MTTTVILLGVMLAPAAASAQQVQLPIEEYYQRQTVKGFGTLADDAFHQAHRDLFPNNGFQNQFTGYHAATDIDFHEPSDAGRPVAVNAVADGTVVYVGTVAGYGGLIIVRHESPEPVTSVYGHVRLADATVQVGQRVSAGHRLAYLGESFSADTSGARKHLHFGIHKGAEVDIAGHEQSLQQLNVEWYNPNDWLARYGAGPQLTRQASPATPTASPEPLLVPEPPEPSFFDRLIDFFKNLFG